MPKDQFIIGMCVVLEKDKFSLSGDYQFQPENLSHLSFKAEKVDPSVTPFLVMTAESYNAMQTAIDECGCREALRSAMLYPNDGLAIGGVMVKIPQKNVVRIDDPNLLNKGGKAWKEYAQALEQWYSDLTTDRQVIQERILAARKALVDLQLIDSI